MVVGGGDIYRQTMARADRLEITHVDADVAGDTRFPGHRPGAVAGRRAGEDRATGYAFVELRAPGAGPRPAGCCCRRMRAGAARGRVSCSARVPAGADVPGGPAPGGHGGGGGGPDAGAPGRARPTPRGLAGTFRMRLDHPEGAVGAGRGGTDRRGGDRAHHGTASPAMWSPASTTTTCSSRSGTRAGALSRAGRPWHTPDLSDTAAGSPRRRQPTGAPGLVEP